MFWAAVYVEERNQARSSDRSLVHLADLTTLLDVGNLIHLLHIWRVASWDEVDENWRDGRMRVRPVGFGGIGCGGLRSQTFGDEVAGEDSVNSWGFMVIGAPPLGMRVRETDLS